MSEQTTPTEPTPEHDQSRIRISRRTAQLAAYLILALASSFAYLQAYNAGQDAKRAIHQIAVEGRERRGQVCLSFEGAHLNEVKQLEKTYAYLVALPANERGTTLNQTVLAGVPDLEKDAKSDQDDNGVFVPDYCDEPNTGRPEPDPVVPKRPAVVTQMLKDAAAKSKAK